MLAGPQRKQLADKEFCCGGGEEGDTRAFCAWEVTLPLLSVLCPSPFVKPGEMGTSKLGRAQACVPVTACIFPLGERKGGN